MRNTTNRTSIGYKRDAVAAIAGAVGPPNPPSPPNAAGSDGKVSFVWTESPMTFPGGYDLSYRITDADTGEPGPPTVIEGAKPTVEVAVDNGTEVCGALRGYADGVVSDWSVARCATAGGPSRSK